VSVSTKVAAAPDSVYALVCDVTKYGEWSPENVSSEWIDGATGPAVGARFKGKNKRRLPWTTTSRVTKADGSTFEFETGKKADTRWRYEVAAGDDAGSSKVTETAEILEEPGAILRWLTKLATGIPWDQRMADLENGMRTTLDGVRRAAEGT
jgi:hypothetical protein